MENLTTKINWILNDYCKAQCSYCPTQISGGGLPAETKDYIRVANIIIDSYKAVGREIDWTFTGGEPLDMNDIVVLLKLCRTNGRSMTLHTNGGKLWMDWWAIEPYVDVLNLTFHYWQQPALMKYIIDTFRNKNKSLNITAPIRPDHFKEDLNRVLLLEDMADILVLKTLLYREADQTIGMFNYNVDDLCTLDLYNQPKAARVRIVEENRTRTKPGPLTPSAKQKIYIDNTSWNDRHTTVFNSNPSYTHQLCNAGVEFLNIGAQGWVSGSVCRNITLGNVWHDGWSLNVAPQRCTMISCIHESDRRITKFPLTDL